LKVEKPAAATAAAATAAAAVVFCKQMVGLPSL